MLGAPKVTSRPTNTGAPEALPELTAGATEAKLARMAEILTPSIDWFIATVEDHLNESSQSYDEPLFARNRHLNRQESRIKTG